MSKNTIMAFMAAVILALVAAVAYLAGRNAGQPPAQTPETPLQIKGGAPKEVEAATAQEADDSWVAQTPEKSQESDVEPDRSVSVEHELPAISPGDTARLPSETDAPHEIISVFEAEATGAYKKWGAAADAHFYYLLKLDAISKVESKEESSTGRIKVVETRTFREATEVVKVSDVRPRVDLSTLPIDHLEQTMYTLSSVVSLLGAPKTGAQLAEATHEFRGMMDSIDGTDAKPAFEMISKFGIDIQKIIDSPVEEYLSGLMEDIHSHVNAVQGKSYRFVYWTEKSGEPVRVRYENIDHSPITSEEQAVLDYVNLFLDCHILPDSNCRPGESWKVDASSFAAMFGAIAEGTCAGEVTVTRGNDLPDGNWTLDIAPATVSFYSSEKRPVGNVKINGGKAIGDARKAVLKDLQIAGRGKLRRQSSRKLWMYEFATKIEGDCDFRSTISPRRED